MTQVEAQRLVISVVQREDADQLVKALTSNKFGSILLSSTGGFLRRGNSTVLTVCGAAEVEQVLDVIRSNASERTEIRDPGISLQMSEWYIPQSISVQRGGASVWVIPADLVGFVRAGGPPSGTGKH